MSIFPMRWLHAAVLALLCAATSLAAESASTLELREARFQRGDTVAEPELVRLPDTWALRGQLPRGAGRYRVEFELPQAPTHMWALRADRISSMHTVSVNGRLVHVGSDLTPITGRPTAQLIELPPGLLRAGSNEIAIEVDYRNRGGLSPLELGPQAPVRAGFVRYVTLSETLPEALNIAGATFGLFMFAIWWRRRGEVAIGWFGALCMLVSVRNYCYFVVDGLPIPGGLSNWLFYMAQLGSTLLFGAFALALSGRRLRWFERALKLAAIVLPVCSVLATGAAQQGLRGLTYPLLIALSMTSLWLVFAHARRVRQHGLLVLLTGLAMVLLGGVHDYFYQQGFVSVLGGYWMPYVTPLALASFALVLVNRLVQALGDVEGLNASLEKRVAERTHALEMANTAKTRFLAAASHDLRQPVVAIGLLVGLVRERVHAPDVQAMLGRVTEAVTALEDLLRGLLDLSRLDSGAVAPRGQPVAVDALFASIESHEASTAAAKGLRLRFRPTRQAVHSDPVLLEQMLRNLVSNAVRYTERGGVLVAARARGPDRVLLQVWDSGRGIAPEHQALVFEEFVQLDNPERDRSKGLGLGLSIVRRSAALLGHSLSLRSRTGRGSCFAIELARGRPAPAMPLRAAPEAPSLPLAGCRLWVLEDEVAVREALVARLAGWGAQVQAFARLVELSAQLVQAPSAPDALLTDQRLPDGSGLQAIRMLRQRYYPLLPALVLTGDTAPADIARLTDSGVPVLHKPFGADALLALLQQTLAAVPATPVARSDAAHRPAPSAI